MKKTGMSLMLVALLLVLAACGSKKPESQSGKTGETDSGAAKAEEKEAKSKIAEWLGKEASAKVAAQTEILARDLAQKVSKDEKVMKEIKALTTKILKDKSIKKQTDKIADKATSGFINKVKLGWKALQAGGVDEYKKQVKEKTTRIATEVINEHIETNVMKDPRMAEIMKVFMPTLQLEGKMAAISLQQNMSPKASQKFVGLALKLSVAGQSEATSKKVETWISKCNSQVADKLEKLLKDVADIKAVEEALENIAIDVCAHERTTKELVTMMDNVMKDKEAHEEMTKAYEHAAFDHGDKAIRDSVAKIVSLKIVNDELFAALGRLAAAQGASSVMEKHMEKVGADPALAALVDTFIIDLLTTCGDLV